MVKPSGQCLTALPPEDLGKKKPNRGPIQFRKRENWGLVQVKNEEEQAAGQMSKTMLEKLFLSSSMSFRVLVNTVSSL